MAKEKTIKTKEGALRTEDTWKTDFIHALSFTALKRYGDYMTLNKNTKKLGFRNWAKGMSIERYERGLLRHVEKYFRNKYEGGEDELDVDHLSGAWFNLQGIMHEESKNSYKFNK
jgi:hypothetical protein